MRWWTTVAVFGLFAAACSPVAEQPAPTTTVPDVTTTTRLPSDEICRSGDLPFSGDGLVAALGDESGDATSVSTLRWDPSGSCERVTVVFASTSGAPAATLGPSSVSVLSFAGIVRATLPPEVTISGVADTLLEGSLVNAIFVVRDQDGVMFLDIHGAEGIPLEARAFTTTSPATLVIDVARQDTAAVPVGVTTTDVAVVVLPTPGQTSYPIAVSGYVEPGRLSLRVQLSASGSIVSDHSIAVPGYTDTWQSYSSNLQEGPSGAAVLFVGILDEANNPGAGAFVSVTME